jgi:cobalt-zinc-cadmium efflux system protein
MMTGWLWLDPAVSLIIVLVIFIGTWQLFWDSLVYCQDSIWAMSTTETALTAHLTKPDSKDDDELFAKIEKELQERYGISHVTIQWERNSK